MAPDKIANIIFECYSNVLLSNFWFDYRNSVTNHTSPKSKKTKFSEKLSNWPWQSVIASNETVLISYSFQLCPFRTPVKYTYMIWSSTLSFTFPNNFRLLYNCGAVTEVPCDSATELGLTISFLFNLWFFLYSKSAWPVRFGCKTRTQAHDI